MKDIAKIILVNDKNQFLFVLRDNNPLIPCPNNWSEIGGAVEKGETPLEALKREIKEEISCEIKNIQYIGDRLNSDESCNIISFRGEFSEELKNIKFFEGQKLGLFNLDEINSLVMPRRLKEFIHLNKDKILIKRKKLTDKLSVA